VMCGIRGLCIGLTVMAALLWVGCGADPLPTPTTTPANPATVAPPTSNAPAPPAESITSATPEPVTPPEAEESEPEAVPDSATSTHEALVSRGTPEPRPPASRDNGQTPAPTGTEAPLTEQVVAPGPSPLPPATPTPSLEDSGPRDSVQDLQDLVKGNSSFALDLYQQLSGEGGNLFFSPYSISLALAMTYGGTRGETESQMEDVLGFRLPQAHLHPTFEALNMTLTAQEQGKGNGGFELIIANSVWGQEGHDFVPAYVDTLALNYGGKVRDVDFRGSPEDARLRINDWVAEETAGRIEDLISHDAIDRFTRLALANAVYFKAEWQSPFDEGATSPAPFYALDGSENRVATMRQTEYFGYARGAGYQAVDLPYKGGAMSMTILVPDEERFGEFESSLDAERMADILEGLESTRVRLAMPRFELEASLDLADTLEAMGMPNAFDDKQAEFQGMDGRSCLAGDDECLYISSAAHKAFVSVDEAGTEAAAATAIIIGITKAEPEEPIRLTIDRPFIYLVRDQETGTVLFLGRVVGL